MIRGLYSATSGMITTSEQHEIISINLANINTPTFKEIQISFSEVSNNIPGNELNGPKTETVWHKNDIGGLTHTGRSLDLAIADPDRYFLLLSNEGQLISRYGQFARNTEGLLIDPNGHILLGNSGPIRLPAEASSIIITENGTVIADGEEIDKIRIVSIVNNKAIIQIGATKYKLNDNLGIRDTESRVLQGYLENSNISINDIFIKMILGNRCYEAIQKTLRMLSDIIQLNTRT